MPNRFNVKAYQKRLRQFREIECKGGSQQDFADKLGIPMKRWNNYERGYPLSRETAWKIRGVFPHVSTEWLWWGMTGNNSPEFNDKLAQLNGTEPETAPGRAKGRKPKPTASLARKA